MAVIWIQVEAQKLHKIPTLKDRDHITGHLADLSHCHFLLRRTEHVIVIRERKIRSTCSHPEESRSCD